MPLLSLQVLEQISSDDYDLTHFTSAVEPEKQELKDNDLMKSLVAALRPSDDVPEIGGE